MARAPWDDPEPRRWLPPEAAAGDKPTLPPPFLPRGQRYVLAVLAAVLAAGTMANAADGLGIGDGPFGIAFFTAGVAAYVAFMWLIRRVDGPDRPGR